MDVANSETVQTETTADEAASTPSTETADNASGGEQAAQSADSTDELAEFTADLSQVPEGLRPHVEKFAKKYELDFKRSYTRKTQELSAKEKQREAEIAEYKGKLGELERVAREVLENPEKLAAYQQLYGVKQQQQEPAPKFETVGDLVNYYENKLTQTRAELERSVEQKMNQTLMQKDMVSRWETAADTLKSTDPKFAKYEKIVSQLLLTEPKYKQMYNGRNEKELFQTALNDIKSLIREDLDEVKKQTLQSVQVKKSSATAAPQKTVTNQGGFGKLDKDAIIARVQARFGSP